MRSTLTFLLIFFLSAAAFAQDVNKTPAVEKAETSATTPAPTTPAPTTNVAAPAPTYEAKKFALLQTLDKVTARTHTVMITVGQPSAVGPLFIDVKTCQKTPPSEQPESAAFLQVWEAKPKSKAKNAKQDENEQSQWVFSGWMFASSPALSAMNHPVYDVWLKDCTNDDTTSKQK